MQKTYESNRLLLKIPDASQAQSLLDYYVRNKAFLAEWEPRRDTDFFTLSRQQELLKTDIAAIKHGQALKFSLFKKDDNRRIIGTVSFNHIIRGIFQSCFLGYRLDKDDLGKGYMTEGLQVGIRIVFDEYMLHRIEANIMPKNTRSLRVVQRLGFEREGLAKKYLKINGKWEDHIHMTLRNHAMEKLPDNI